jgi:GTPase
MAASNADDVMDRAAESLRRLLDDPDIPASVREAMAPEFAELARALAKLEQDELHVAVFGRVSVGKSALLNALLGRDEFEVGVLHGTTKLADQSLWQESYGAGIHVIDTPGIDELGGEARERLAQSVAQRVDLILFVIEADITETELVALRTLVAPTRPIVLVLNKSDRYTQAEIVSLMTKLRERVAGLVPPDQVVWASAKPRERIVIRVDAQGQEQEHHEPRQPDLAQVRKRMSEILDRDGKTIAALNAGLMAGALADQVADRLIHARREVANKLIQTYSLSKGVAVGLNPIPIADLVAAAGLDIALIVHLSRVYGLPMTKVEAGELIGTICAQLAVLMGAIWGVHVVASALKGLSVGLSTMLTGTAQGALAYYATTLTGKAAQRYLQNGKSWGELGPKRVVQSILDELDRDSMLRQAKAEIGSRLRGN